MALTMHSATIFVADKDATIDFYVKTLGFEKREDTAVPGGMRWVMLALPGAQTGVALMTPAEAAMGGGSGSVGGYTGISFTTTDLQGLYDRWQAAGVQFASPPQLMPWGAKATWFSDRDGNSFFLTEG